MVARSTPTLRFSSVRHRDPPPAPATDPGKIPSFAHDTTTTTTVTTTVTTRRNAVIQQRQQQKHHQLQTKLTPFKQTKLPFAPGSGAGPPPPPRQHQQQPTKTIPAPERPFKKAKLDGRHHDQASITGPAKLPLRSRDSQGGLLTAPDPSSTSTTAPTTTTTSAASRTRSATATAATTTAGGDGGETTTINNKSSSKPATLGLAAPPRSPASAVSRTTRKSAHGHNHAPVAVSEDVDGGEKKGKRKQVLNGIMIADDHDNDDNDKCKNDRIVTSLVKDGGGGASPSTATTTATTAVVGREKRSLRSNDGGSRSKSELAMYFQNYEQILSLEPVKPEFLSADTAVLLVDDLTQPIVLDPLPANAPAAKPRGKHDKGNLPNGPMVQSLMDNPLLELYDAQILDLRPSTHSSKKPSRDPLDDDVYFKAHRRIERQEKQLRNIERERAQHEKVQLDRLLDELQGHDWLRVMGINGITETEKKLYEPKRAYFIKEVSALIDKFRAWKEEERRRKIERDQCLADEDDDDEEEEEEEENDDNEENETEDEDEDEDEAEEVADQFSIGKEDTSAQPNGNGDEDLESFSPNFQTYGEPPDINDVDAWAARQLHQEAISASSNTARHSNLLPEHVSIPPPPPSSSSSSSSSSPPSSSSSSPTSTSTSYPAHAGRDSDRAARAPSPATTHTSAPAPTPPPPPQQQQPPAHPEPQPFTSFYTKRHLRDAAVGKIRRGRTRTAFGQPLPEITAREFRLPPDILTDEAIDACQRKKRRLRRARKS
ncbi:hypothetical protein GX51_04108 [Blastomyces parvus]|uniref:Something about silencing protein 4 domain-containing protein n=1 Tax=Blastomyces parvus TaxID=2060905 RepID=A0A2B7X3P4_9EURO|nr:hypothetical protein GX51_04108 [Blastomyces parvus]